MYPKHPNLLPAFYDDPKSQDGVDYKLVKHWVSKPLFGREGLGVMLSQNFSTYDQFVKVTEENFGRDRATNEKLGKSIYQAYAKLPEA